MQFGHGSGNSDTYQTLELSTKKSILLSLFVLSLLQLNKRIEIKIKIKFFISSLCLFSYVKTVFAKQPGTQEVHISFRPLLSSFSEALKVTRYVYNSKRIVLYYQCARVLFNSKIKPISRRVSRVLSLFKNNSLHPDACSRMSDAYSLMSDAFSRMSDAYSLMSDACSRMSDAYLLHSCPYLLMSLIITATMTNDVKRMTINDY